MDFFKVINERRSVRTFTGKPVEAEKLQKILETANAAPSAGNLQGYEIYLVTKVEQRTALVKAAHNQEFIADAAVTLVFCANPARSVERYKERGIRLYAVQDATIACTYAMLTCVALGLATVWVGAFEEDAVRHAVGIPPELIPVAMLPIGYAGKKPGTTSRRALRDLVHKA